MSLTTPILNSAAQAYKAGRLTEAADHCRAALKVNPNEPTALQMLSIILFARGHAFEAIELARRAADVLPNSLECQANLGTMLLQGGRAAEALASFDRALTLEQRNPALLNSRAAALQALGRPTEALASYDKALRVAPAHPDALLSRGHILSSLGRATDALASYDRALAIEPANAQIHYARGNALLALSRYDDAITAYEDALALSPAHVEALNNLSNAYHGLGRYVDALAIQHRLLALQPSYDPARLGRALIYLTLGRFSEGWVDHRARQSVQEHRELLFQDRLPDDIDGRTLWLRKDQGLGDELFFLRFAPELKRRGARLMYQSGAKIADLFRRTPYFEAVLGEDALIPEDAQVLSIGDLPYALAASRVAPPLPLAPLTCRLEAMRKRLASLGPAPYIAVTWRAGTREMGGLYKEAPDTSLASILANMPGTLVSVQRSAALGEVATFAAAAGRPVHDFGALNDDLEDMLALMALADEYVCVSNTNTHLRASAGRTSRVLVPFPPDYRWMAEGDESPWFPGTRIYRQAPDRSWGGALARLRADLVRP